jgi:transcriptional regulator with GAF, ATPase, and Fis domain
VLPQGWANLVALLDGRPDTDPMARAKRLCELSVQISEASGATLVIVSEETRSTVCATDEVSDRLEDIQLQFSEGPTLDAVREKRIVLVPDLADPSGRAESRWPWYAPAAVAAGVGAVFVFPVQIGAMMLGALSLYRAAAGELSREQLKDANTLADAAAVLLSIGHGAHTAEAFVWAMDDRSRFRAEVHQAVGATMVQLDVDPKQAFALLRAHAFATGRPIAEVAADIMGNRLRLELD